MSGGRVEDEQLEETEDQPARLPEDVLAAILRRVPPRWLAVSRCVCRAWRDAVDGLLRADLLPLSLAGLFVHFDEHEFPEFFARPSSSTAGAANAVSGDLSFLPPVSGHIYDEDCFQWCRWGRYGIQDHCNGLLLLSRNCVVNPATRRWHTLPPSPPKLGTGSVKYRAHLVYDPMISPYYDVVMIPTLDSGDEVDLAMEELATVPMQDVCVLIKARLSLSNNMYRVIKPPKDATEDRYDYQVVRSKKGVYFVSLDKYWPWYKCWLRVWILDESRGRTEWMLKLDKDLKPLLARHRLNKRFKWILEDINYNLFLSSVYPEDNKKPTGEESVEWNSDDDVEEEEDMVDNYLLQDNMKSVVKKEFKWNSNDHNDLNYGDTIQGYSSDEERHFLGEEHYIHSYSDVEILGFHPYKEIIFLSASERTGLAYHLNESKIEELGNIYPKEYVQSKQVSNEQEKIKSFPYTPCWIEEFPG
ncbi:hypothetical protein ACQ4PT_064399 [Festuca glaucescens]